MTDEERIKWRQGLSDRAKQAFRDGRIKPQFGIGSKLETKKGGSIRTRSSYETRYVEMLELDDDVVNFQYEPFDIDYEHDGVVKSYIPDFLVFRRDRCELVEVKPNRFVSTGRNPAKFKAARRFCIEEGFDFVIVSEVMLGI